MIVPIKQIILEDASNPNSGIGRFYDKVASDTNNIKFGKYGKKAKVKDLNVLKFSGLYGGGLGAIAGQTMDSFIDGSSINHDGTTSDELTGNGLVGGALIGSGASALYGLNNNHKLITKKDHYEPAKNYTKKFITNLKYKLSGKENPEAFDPKI